VRPTPIINVHCGITPRYRGTHGAFWAVVEKDWENIGVTVHYLDKGIDTGRILAQATLDLDPTDNPRTLVLKQYQAAIPLVLGLVSRLAAGDEETIDRPDLDSRIYSSPTFSAYLKFRRLMRQLPEISRGLR
jgi:methionyl-tRNA formyltransferase